MSDNTNSQESYYIIPLIKQLNHQKSLKTINYNLNVDVPFYRSIKIRKIESKMTHEFNSFSSGKISTDKQYCECKKINLMHENTQKILNYIKAINEKRKYFSKIKNIFDL